jgi:hypothetical protein
MNIKQLAVILVIPMLLITGVLTTFRLERNNANAMEPDKTEYECPEGYFWRGGCVKVTGCPYGDSIPMDKCAQFADDPINNPPKSTKKKSMSTPMSTKKATNSCEGK